MKFELHDNKCKRNKKFMALINAHGANIYRHALWLTKDKQSAENITKEAYLQAWSSLNQLESINVARTWLITVVRHENAVRFAKKEPLNLKQYEYDENETTQDEVFAKVRILRKAINSTPLIYKEPLTLQVILDTHVTK